MCYGREREKHDVDCTWRKPKCRWRKPSCCCDAYHYPHRPGSGLCGSPERRDALMYGTALRPPTIGEVSERVWWAARAAVVEELGLADGNVVITEEQGTRAADLLRGVVPASPTVPALRGHALREWYKARRAVVDLLLPLVIQRGGAVIPPDTAAHIRGLLNGTVRVPTLRDARTLAKSKAPAYELAKPKLDEHAVVPF